MRRVVDILVGWFCLVLATPAMIILALLIKRGSPGSVFYIPKMVGQHGTLFPLFRFRTMYTSSADQPHPDQPFTLVGSFIRNYSLDHLPMLINLTLGHLTIVGPRPMEPDVIDTQAPLWRTYLHVKPGILNYAILRLGKMWTPSRTTHPQHNQMLELYYIQHRSGWGDFKIIARFVRALITSKGNIKARKEPDVPLES